MKNYVVLLCILFIITSCKTDTKDAALVSEIVATLPQQKEGYDSFGVAITADDAIHAERMLHHFNSMNVGDTLVTTMSGTIAEVCTKMGCWMTLDMGDAASVHITFKDYGFFVPTNATGDVVVKGKAFVKETSVEMLRHYAEDAGKTAEEIASITAPQKTYAFIAEGVLLKKQ